MCTMTAKYSGQCRACGKRIRVGEQIDYSKASGARHAACASGASTSPHAASSPSHAGDCTGSTILYRDLRDGMRRGKPNCSAELGRSWRAGPKAGAIAGQIVTCVGCSRSYQSDADNEDMGDMRGGGWTLALYVRPATEEESVPVIEEEAVEAEKAAVEAHRAALLSELTRLVQTPANRLPEEQSNHRPDGRIVTIRPGVHGSGVEVAILSEGGTVSIHHGGHYDDYRSSLWTTRHPRAVAIMTELLGGAS